MWCCDRISGVTDHFAENDAHALTLARSIVANLNWKDTFSSNQTHIIQSTVEEPAFPVEEMGAVIPADTKKPFDIRKVLLLLLLPLLL